MSYSVTGAACLRWRRKRCSLKRRRTGDVTLVAESGPDEPYGDDDPDIPF